jgi:NAD(P)-dependent dehydrogenase (short-subunit alcohol dehydrogenase family)
MSKPNIVITGSTGNLGKAVVKTFTSAGYHVIGTHEPHHEAKNDENVSYFGVNLIEEEDTKNFFTEIKEKYSQIDGLVCLAGGFAMSNIENTSKLDILDQVNLNFITAFNSVKNAYSWMKSIGGGSIVLISAKPALDGGGFEVLPYALAKGMIKNMANLLNENAKKDKIVTSIIAPSIIDTPPNRESMSDADFSDWVTPQNIAENIVHLFSDTGKINRKPVLRLYNNA